MSGMSMIGKTLGSYTIEEQLGAGGMAKVYRGRHVHLERDVAIKVMHAHLAERAGLRDRFLNEARANASLKHAGIVQIYDFDVADGVAYIAMEMLDGRSLEDRCHELADGGAARFELDEALAIVTAIGEALSYAHGRGVVHRDIKPSNIMLTVDGRAVLTDFGLAAVLDQTRLTTDGTSAGTPSYMSPEQAAGERGDHRADIYSLGVVLYQLLAGELPLQSDNLVGMINKLINEPAPPLADKVPAVPEHVAAAVSRALEKEPDNRFASVDEMLAALRGDASVDPAELAGAARGSSPQRAAAAPPATASDAGAEAHAPAAVTAAAAPLLARRWVLALVAIVAVTGAGWWLVGRGAGPESAVSGDAAASGAPATEEGIDSMAAEVDSMVPKVESMVPEGEVESMAAVTGWRDGFEDNGRGWETSSGTVVRALVDGGYEIDLRSGGQAVSAVAEAGGEFADFEYAATGALVEGQPESGYGLVFRRVDARNYYVFAVNGIGQWSIWVLQDGTWRELRGRAEAWTPSDAIEIGASNRLSVRAVGSAISAAVNGVELVSLEDETFAAGRVGFYTASSRTATAARARVRFDDAEVRPAESRPR